ncbi:cold shock CspA family protein/ribosome-associated translation inhibitor RaiA [Microvirga flocculans]|uniref:Cold shock CspA family protein/ribosome-associated translation inhibitor RaiA n=1 Tax=Microvirga flocculans TaxID=217168 RepID=A0A7W6N6N0_9HYPH|nr:HPF/RaiA family ribosome-associated protein [Microvirga flocculans]MBB4038776.1 cold shock CspA family protein/ribosome-associated translation inhibitor RaiA [Microvirga flocculans]
MQIPAQIDFQGFEPTEQQRALIDRKLSGLEEFFDRITACRFVMKAPRQHHRTSGQYEVNIHLVLPDGHEVAVERTPPEDERFADPEFAINDAFSRVRRRLQDEVRRLRGDVKAHEPQPIATVRRVQPEEDYGFLETGDGREIYFHRNSVLDDAFAQLKPGVRVTFVEEAGEKGAQASTVRILGKHGLR